MELRQFDAGDATRITELVESSMTSSFRLSPQQIASIVEREFEDRLPDTVDDPDDVVLVAEADTNGENTVVGFLWGSATDGHGDVRWLFVDPEHRGRGIGTELLESGLERLQERGAEELRAYALQASMDGHQFFERYGFEQVDERQTDVGDETLAQFVYAFEEGS